MVHERLLAALCGGGWTYVHTGMLVRFDEVLTQHMWRIMDGCWQTREREERATKWRAREYQGERPAAAVLLVCHGNKKRL